MGGQAVADVISGVVNPSGKLPITYPMYEDGGGSPYFHAVSDQCTRQDSNNPLPHWDYVPCIVQWPFGFGLTYTLFEYSLPALSTKRLAYSHRQSTSPTQSDNLPLKISVNVKNKGSVPGYDTVFFFTFDEARSTTPDYKRLRAFEKVFLEAGAETTVTVSISIEDLRFVGPHDDAHLILEPGLQFRVGIGATTDCRAAERDSVLCTDLVTLELSDDYNGACEAACELWGNSGCSDEFKMSSNTCWSMCTSIAQSDQVKKHLGEGEDGWGWNYVRCLESVTYGFQQLGSFDKQSQCGKMTSLCRDVFRTEGNDSFGHGPNVSPSGRLVPDHTSVIIALCAGLVASLLVVYALRGGFSKQGRRGSIQFTRVSNEDALTA
jgi:Fibronectin type III-like domain/Glycosyl hydrolase family 3 C-terminal domain